MRSIVLNVEKARVPLKGGASSIPCKNIPVYGRGIAKVRTSPSGGGASSRAHDSVSEPYKGMPSGNGLGQRDAAAALPELRREIDRTYELKGVAAVLGLVRFLAQIVPKC